MQSAVDRKLRHKFDAAARSTNNLLSVQGAKDAGWGFLADHFAEIDSRRDGYLTFDEVQTFLDARSPLPAAEPGLRRRCRWWSKRSPLWQKARHSEALHSR